MLQIYLSMLETEEEQAKMTQIYNTYRPLMLRYALKILNNPEQAEDAVHDAIIAVIRHKEKYFSVSCTDLGVPLVIITRNKCLDILKKVNPVVDDPFDDMEHLIESGDMSIEERLVQSEEYEVLIQHISELNEASRTVLEMRYILNLSHKDIAELLGITPAHVNTKITRAKAKIRKLSTREGKANG